MNKPRGFSLIELVVGIVVLAIAMIVMNTMLISQSKDALEPLYRLRASQLGQSILQDVLSRAYDQNSDHNGGYYRCGEIWQNGNLWFDGSNWQLSGTPTVVNCSAVLGVDSSAGEVVGLHENFNDVDDFIQPIISAVEYGDVLGVDLPAQYNNYFVTIDVSYYTVSAADAAMKLIDVTITTPSGENILFSALKGNY